MRRVFCLTGSASVVLNDLYPMSKESSEDVDLPTLIAIQVGCTQEEAIERTVDIHNELMHTFVAEATVLRALAQHHRPVQPTQENDHMTSTLPTPYQKSVADYWNVEKDPVNIKLGEVDGLFHHHYGVGEVDWSVMEGPAETRDARMIEEMHRLETARANLLLDALGDIGPDDHLLDAGCGRGGTSIMANARVGCSVDGVSISAAQVEFANARAAERGVADKVRYHVRNMLDTGFESGSRAAIWNSESTMHVDLFRLFAEHARQLRFGGRYVTVTGCSNDVTGLRSKAVSRIDEHYICNIHPRSEYFEAMAANDLVPVEVTDLTAATIPYWEFRAQSSVATGIEDPFLTAYKEGSFHYLLVVADRV